MSVSNISDRGTSTTSDEDVDLSIIEDNNDCNTTIGSASLRDELLSVNKMLANLKTACPGRSNLLRQTKKSSTDTFFHKMIEYLDQIYSLNTKLIDKIDELTNENHELRKSFHDISTKKSFAAAVSTGAVSPGRTHSSASQISHATQPNHPTSLPPELQKISSKVDQLEQDALSNIIMLQGESIDHILSDYAKTTAVSSNENDERIAKSQPTALKLSVRDLLRPHVAEIAEEGIVHVSVHGKDRKHLKVVCSSTSEKNSLLSSLKRVRPSNLFANEYLTKLRSSLLYKLRSLRKKYQSIRSVYSRSGVIYYRLNTIDRPISVSDESDINKLEEKMINSHT